MIYDNGAGDWPAFLPGPQVTPAICISLPVRGNSSRAPLARNITAFYICRENVI